MAGAPIVGLWVRAPGCGDLHEMRQNLYINRDNIKALPDNRPCLGKLKRQHPALKAALVDGIDEFDDSFFGVSESEALFMDPQQRLLLQGVVHALEDAGITLQMVNTYQPAVYTASWCYDYKDLLPADQYMASGNSAATMCGRISYFFNSRGASVGVETACSSSLVALHLARQSILVGESQLAIVCGANHVGARSFNSLYQSHMVSPDGRSAAFDRSANGFVRAESFTVAIICSESFAKEHNLRVRCHVVGSAFNNDGRTASLIAPNPVAQHEVQMSAMKDIDRLSVDVVTCHGTGTKLGDQVEITAINKSFKPDIRIVGPKSSLGHGEGSAGLIGVFQSVLLMQEELLPAQLHVSLPIDLLEDKSLAVVCEEINVKRIAVSSYGFGGTNSSVVLDSFLQKESQQEAVNTLNVLLLSAKSPKALEEQMRNYAEFLSTSDQRLVDILHTTNNRRTFYENRVAVVGKTRWELIKNLLEGTVIQGVEEEIINCQFGSAPLDLISFRALLEICPELKAAFDKRCNEAAHLGHADTRAAIFFPFRSAFSQQILAIAELIAVVVLFDVLEQMNALPKTVSGGGMSAVKAATAAGFISLADGIQLLTDKTTAVQTQMGRCLMVKGKTSTRKMSPGDIHKLMEKKDDSSFSFQFTVGGKKVESSSNLLEIFPKIIGQFFVAGVDVRPHSTGQIVVVPSYPFQKMSFWPSESIKEIDEEDHSQVDTFDMVSVANKVREVVLSFVSQLDSDETDIIEGEGLDSLSTIEMVRFTTEKKPPVQIEAIGTAFQIQMPFDILESAPTVAAIADFIAENLQKSHIQMPDREHRKTSEARRTEIGIVAADFKFSGGISSFEDFWEAMMTGKVLTKNMNDERKKQIGTEKDFQTGLLGIDISRFDGGFFGISKDEAQMMDPQHRLLLHSAYNAWEKAGQPQMSNADLFLAVAAHSEYRALAERHVDELDDRLWTGTNHSMMAGRMAQLLGIRGRALVVDTTCSSVASAVEMCLTSILKDGRDWGVVAATQCILSAPYMDSLRSLLPQDYTKSFSVEASGFVRSEAIGVFIIKRLEPHEPSLLLIEAAKAAHSGAVVTPVVASVAKLVEECGPVDYIEGHGTATAVGDGVEAMAYQAAGGGDLLMSSSKAQFGHSEAASGLLQLCKVIKVMEEDTIPAILHNSLPNEHIRNNTSMRLPYITEEKDVMSATVVSFGITGTKTAILAKRPPVSSIQDTPIYQILPISAKTKSSLQKAVFELTQMIGSTSLPVAEIAKSLQLKKTQNKWRMAVVSDSHPDAIRELNEILSRPPPSQHVLHVPVSPYQIFHGSFSDSDIFHAAYRSLCQRLRFEPFSDETSLKHRLASAFAFVKSLQNLGIQTTQIAASGPFSLILMALFEVVADHYVNDLLLACLAGDIRLMKRITRDLNVSLPAVKFLNIRGEQLKAARHFVDACFLEDEPVEFEAGTVFIGETTRDSFRTLYSYRDLLSVLADQFMAGGDVNWSQFGRPQPTTALPEYPFDMRSYWLPLKRTTIAAAKAVTVDLNGTEWSHVKDHVINGEVIVPGATSLRIIEQLQTGKTIYGIDFLSPIIPYGSEIIFTVKESDGVKTLCADGMDAVSYSIREEKLTNPSVSVTDTPKKNYKKNEIYDRFSLSALMYQQRFQVISSIGVSLGKGVAELNNVDRVDILIDGALQAVAMGYLLEQPADHHPWLPFNIESVKIFNSRPDGQAKAYFTYVNNGSFLNGDVSVFDRDGNLLVDINNVCFRRKEIEGRAAVPVAAVKKSAPLVKSSAVLREKAKNYVLKWFDESFGWNELDEKAGFFDLGLSSLQAVRLRNYLREEYPSASTTSVFDHPTIFDLSNYLASLQAEPEEADIVAEEIRETLLPILPPSRLSQTPIGIRSSACRLPSGIEDPADFWQFLLMGKNASSRTPASRIPSRNVLIKGQKYGASVDGGNFIEQDVAAFDPSFFKISKSEAEMMDPQQRLLLECVEECIENSGDVDMTEVGVFVGLMEKEYVDLMEQQQTTILSMLGSMVAVIAGRVNYVFGSYGPSVTVDTACSSSLVAVEMAVNALLDGRCRRAIVAGVNLILSEKGQGHRSNGKMLSAHGMSLSFDARASGYGRSDGCVVLMLEKVKPTVQYLSVLNGVNVNHGGRSVSLTAPNGVAHKMLLTNLFKTTPGVEAAVWEAHGTGTSLGDPIEVNTLSSLLQDVVISSAKASLGHGEASAGTCGLLKLSLTLGNDYVPPLIHFHVLNKDIQTGSLRLPIIGEEQNFDVGGISSFGVSGTNAAVLAQRSDHVAASLSPLYSSYLLPISAKSNNSLIVFKSSICQFIDSSQESLSDICGVLSSRIHHPKRIALLVSRGRVISLIEKSNLKSEFSLAGENLHYDILAIEAIAEYFEYLERYNLSDSDRLLLALIKFLKNVISTFKWQPTSTKSQVLFLLASNSLETNEESIRLLDGVVPDKYRDRMAFDQRLLHSSTISIGKEITNLETLLYVLGELFVAGVDLDWSSIYSPPSRYVHIPTYPFNRQTVWFAERKPVYDHSLLGTETSATEHRVEFENQLSPKRHSAIFKNGFGIGEAVLSIVEAATRAFASNFKITHLQVNSFKPEQALWLTTTVERGERCQVIGKSGTVEIFRCNVKKTSASPISGLHSPTQRGKHLYFGEIPSTIVREFEGATTVHAVYDCPYTALFRILERKGYIFENIELDHFLSLPRKFEIRDENGRVQIGTEETVCLELFHQEISRHTLEKVGELPSMIEKTNEESQPEIAKKDTEEETKKKLVMALNDVLLEEIGLGDSRGFMEMGMDSLTLVDFVNRLNERYFPQMEISTTDVFDHPSVAELSKYLTKEEHIEELVEEKLANQLPATHAAIEPFNDVQERIRKALVDVLPEEPTDFTQGFMELGMDSLTLVDFVNRLNEKYFPVTEVSTTDIFDHPSLEELSRHMASLQSNSTQEETQPEDVKPVAELLLGKGMLEEVKKKICLALADVLPEEPEDYSVGFMEMGMDSLTLVDFVNRLNEKYFPQLETSTTDVFDNPTMAELSANILGKVSGSEEALKVNFDSGVGCSGETSPKPEEEGMLEDAFFFVEAGKDTKADYRMLCRGGKLVIFNENNEVIEMSKLSPGKILAIELDDGQINSESLFLGLIDFCKQLEKARCSTKIVLPPIFSSAQFMARAFMKTAAAEKPDFILYQWNEHLQRKNISKIELQGKITGFWLITGGLSGIGLSTAKWLVDEGVEGVALVSRRQPDGLLNKELGKMRKRAKVVVISADVTNEDKMSIELKKLGKVDGVIHCAGVLQDGKMERQNATSFKKVFEPKAGGYDVLERVLDKLRLIPSTFIAMSSFTSACGNVGQLNYGVANAYLDYKMMERRRRGLAGISIHWGNWLEIGMASNKNIHKILSEYGFLGFSTDEGLKYLKYAILNKPERFMAAKLDWKVILDKRKDIRTDLIKDGYFQSKRENIMERSLESFEVIEEDDLESEEEGEDIRQILLDMAQDLVKSKVKTNKSFMEIGFTSHALTALLEMIKQRFNVKLTVAAFYEYPTLDELAEHLEEVVEMTENQPKAGDKIPSSYCDLLAMSVWYDDKEDFNEQKKKAKEFLSGKTAQIKGDGKYLQQIQGSSVQEVLNQLSKLEYKETERKDTGKLVMMFSGQGAQYPLMGAQLAESLPEFKRTFHRCLAMCDDHLQGEISLLEIVNDPNQHRQLLLTSHMQPIMFSFCYSLGHLWKSLGVVPNFYLGHSVGELVAGTLAGIMTLEEGIRLIVARAKAMERIRGRGAMLAVDSRAVDEVLAKFDVSPAAVNSPKQLVVAGKKKILDEVLKYVKGKQLQATFVNAMYPFHSSLITEEDLVDLRRTLNDIQFKTAEVPIVSNVTGKLITTFDEEYLIRHTVSPVKFVDCVNTLVKEGVHMWLEAGPSATLCQFLKRIVEPKEHLILQSIQDKGDDCLKFIETAMELEQNGSTLQWEGIYCEMEENEENHPVMSIRRVHLEISEEEALVAGDHKMNGEVIVPGMLQIAALLNEVNKDSTEDFFTLSSVRLPSSWKPAESRMAEMSRSFDNRLGMEVAGSKTCLANLKLRRTPWKQALKEDLFGDCNIPVDIHNWYVESGKNGLHYGPHFQVLRDVTRDDKRAIGKGIIEKKAFIWPLMDAALHLICSVVYHRREPEYYVPVSINDVFLAKDIDFREGEEVTSFAELIADNKKFIQFNSCLKIGDRVIFEARNATCVVFKAERSSLQLQSGDTDGSKIGTGMVGSVRLEPRGTSPSMKSGSQALTDPFSKENKTTQEIVLVGSAGSFCFASVDLPSLWQQLQLGVCSHRYSHRHPIINPNVSFLDQDITRWDPEFFGISPKEAQYIDPMQRLLMVMVYRALESAGHLELPVNTGVYVGQSGMDFIQMVYKESSKEMAGHLAGGTHGSCLSGRISHWLKLEGPSVVVETACSSSFTALSLAAEAISQGKIEVAIVAGIHLILHDVVTQVLTNGGMLSTYSKVFDASADGYRRSEAVGVVILSSKEFAVARGLSQLIKLTGWHLSHNGKSAAMQVPNGNSQEDCMRRAGDVTDEVELHATGTSLGDPIESSAVLRLGTATVSSIKCHLGHAEGASGMASLLPVILQMENEYRLPQLHLSCPNPKISNITTRFVGEEVSFNRIRMNNFGFSGSNVSMTLEKIPRCSSDGFVRMFYLIPISAKSKESLQIMSKQIKEALLDSDVPLSAFAGFYQSQPQYRYREVFLADYRRRLVDEESSEGSVDYCSEELLSFLYGEGVSSAPGDVLSKIQHILYEAGVVSLPTEMPSPRDFFKIIRREFLRGTTISWKALDNFQLSRPVNLPGYHFNDRRFWCLENHGKDERTILNEDIYFESKLIEKTTSGNTKKRTVQSVHGDAFSYPRIKLADVSNHNGTVFLFHPTDSSYSEAIRLCRFWETVEEDQQNIIVVACLDNGSSFLEWTALLKSLAAEKLLEYSFVSYQTEQQLKQEMKHLEIFESVYYREGKRLVERLLRVTPRLKKRSVEHLVISGGNGGIGKEITRHLSPKQMTNLSRSTGYDLSSPTVKLPSLSGVDLVIHAAGRVGNALMANQTEEKFKSVGDVKINGFHALSQLQSKEIVLISSSAAIFGSVGQSNYAFANGKMVSEAEKSGKSFRAIHYGPWNNVGMLAGRELSTIRKQIEENGWNFLDPSVAATAAEADGSFVVFSGNFERILDKNGHLRNFLEMIVQQPSEPKVAERNPRVGNEKTIRELLREISGLTNLEEERNTPLMQLGLDSLMMEELRTKIRKDIGVKLSSADIYDNCTLALLEALVDRKKKWSSPERSLEMKKLVQEDHKIAVIAASGVFSNSRNIEEYWENLMAGKDCITREDAFPGFVSAAGIAPDVGMFDYKFFKMTKKEADALDPQVRVFVQLAYNALEASGYVQKRRTLRVAVFAGAEPSEYTGLEEEPEGSLQRMFRGNMKDFVATMTAHALDLNGPAVGVYSACSTALLALQQAANSIRLGQADIAIVGAISLVLPGETTHEFQEGMVLSITGQCRPFDVSADGTVRGSAGGCLILKGYRKAVEDNDHILAVIHAIGTSNDGAIKASFMAPNTKGQAGCIQEGLRQLNEEERERIEYVECHGTGTLVGDEIELKALREVYKRRLILGSVKANIGHGFAGAGMAAMIKAILMLETGWIPPQINFDSPIEGGGHFEFSIKGAKLQENALIGVSSFGIGGTNGHVILGRGPKKVEKEPLNLPVIIPLSANSQQSLANMKEDVKKYLIAHPEKAAAVASTFQQNRETYQHRSSLIFVNPTTLWETPDLTQLGALSPSNLAFFFTPQGVQYSNMEKGLFEQNSTFSRRTKELCHLASEITGINFEDVMYPTSSSDETLIMQPDLAQVAVFIVNMATITQLEEWGIGADRLLGHSVGEYAALVYAGALSEEEAVQLLYRRGKLCYRTPEAAMIAIEGDLPSTFPQGVEISAILSEKLHCVVGPPESILILKNELRSRRIEFRDLRTERGFHSYMLDDILGEFQQEASRIEYHPPKKKIISGMDGKELAEITPQYLSDHMRQPVNLKDSLQTLLLDGTVKVLVEIGPAGVLGNLLLEKYPHVPHVNTVPSKKKTGSMWECLAVMWSLGYPINWSQIYHLDGNDPWCPGYNFEKTLCWKERIPLQRHQFYSMSWIPLTDQRMTASSEIVVIVSDKRNETNQLLPKKLSTWDKPLGEVLVYLPSGSEDSFHEIQETLGNILNFKARKLLIVSQGNPLDWQVLGPCREFQLLHTEPRCQFVYNPDNLPVQEVADKTAGIEEEILLITRHGLYKMGYSQVDCDHSEISHSISGVVAIFGGTGALGSAYVSVLKRIPTVKKIVVIGRRMRTTTGDGVDYEQGDITSPEQVANILSRVIHENGQLDVVVNLAGITTRNSLSKSREEMEKVLLPKVKGTQNVLSFLEKNNRRLSWLILSSSLSSYVPLQGNSDYAAANCYLDALAMKGHPLVERIQTIQWPLWKQSKMAVDSSAVINSFLNRGSISQAQGQRAIWNSLSLSGPLAYSLISPVQLKRVIKTAQLGSSQTVVASEIRDKLELIKQGWRETLGGEITGRSNFFDLGGNSLNAMRLVWFLKNAGIDISVNYVFAYPVFEDFYENLPKERRKEAEEMLDVLSPLPLSYAQENMMLLRKLEPGPQYNILFVIEFGPNLDQARMTAAVRCLLSRQTALRTRFREMRGIFSQEVLSLTESYHRLDRNKMEEKDYEAEVEKEKNRYFDFEDVPLRIKWFETASGWKLLFSQHHILTDGWSMSVLAKELTQLYKRGDECLPLHENVAIFAQNDRRKDFGQELEETKGRLECCGTTEVIRDTDRDHHGYKKLVRTLPSTILSRIKQLAREYKTTDFIICLSSYLLTLRKWKAEVDEDRMVIGIPVSGRNEQSQNLIGYFLNNAVLDVQLREDYSLEETIPLVEMAFSEARKRENVPFHKLVAAMKVERRRDGHPIFQMYFNYRHALEYPEIQIGGTICRVRQISMNTLFDFSTTIDETPKGLKFTLEFNRKYYDADTIQHFVSDMFTGFLGRKRTRKVDGKRQDIPLCLIPGLTETGIEKSLEQEYISTLGMVIRADTVVILDMSPNSAAWIIPAALRVGMAFAPIDPTWPLERKRKIISSLKNALLLDENALSRLRRGHLSGRGKVLPTNLAYVIHTSGSTGTPKGVAVTHRNLLSFLSHATRQMLLHRRSKVYHSVNTVFDVSIANILGAAVNSAQLVSHTNLNDQIREAQNCSFVFLTSAVFNSLSQSQLEQLVDVEKLFVGGETIQERNLLRALGMGIDVTQIYGPTETTIWSLTNRCKLESGVGNNIGHPMDNETAYADGGGGRGELVLEGPKVARGYLHGESFHGVYKTKDLVRLKSRKFLYKGRLDGQVKIRGNRVELGEVEKYLLDCSGARNVAVLKSGESLVAFLVDPEESSPRRLQSLLGELLPAYSIPSAFISVAEISRNSNGKIDKTKLLQEFNQQQRKVPNTGSGETRDIVNSVEERMFRVFGKTLDMEVTRLEENFFDLGGHSLLLLSLQQNIKDEFGVELLVSDLFARPTVEGAAAFVMDALKPSLQETDISIITKLREAPNPKFNAYLIHAVGGAIFPYYAFLQMFPKDVSVYAIEYQLEYPADSLKELAALYAKTVAAHTKTIRPFVLGHSMGGTISREMIPDLKMWGWEIPFIVMFDSWVLRPEQLKVEKIREFMETVFAPLPNAAVRVERAVKLGTMLKGHKVTKSHTKVFLFKSKELGVAAFREAVRPDLNEELSRSLVANGFDRVSYKPVTTWMINGDHESCLKVENLKTRQKEFVSIFNEYL